MPVKICKKKTPRPQSFQIQRADLSTQYQAFMLGELTQISERDGELLPPPAYFSSAALTPWSLRGTQGVEEKNLLQFLSSGLAVKTDVSLLSPWSKHSRSFQFTLQLSQLWPLSDRNIFCTLLIIRQPAREGRVTNEGSALSVLCLSLESRDQPSSTQSQETPGLVSIWVFHESLAQGQMLHCVLFHPHCPFVCYCCCDSSTTLCPEGGEVPSCA